MKKKNHAKHNYGAGGLGVHCRKENMTRNILPLASFIKHKMMTKDQSDIAN